jgi:hypothetical protein
MNEPHFVLNRNEGVDTIHDPAHLTERCNTDQIEGRQRIDTLTAAAMLDRGEAVHCQHCNQEEPS